MFYRNLLGLPIGIAFGIFLEKGDVHYPHIIKSQMLFRYLAPSSSNNNNNNNKKNRKRILKKTTLFPPFASSGIKT